MAPQLHITEASQEKDKPDDTVGTSGENKMKSLLDRLLKETFSIYYQVRAPLVYRMLALDQEDKVLDIGCHQGNWSVKLVARVNLLVGIDINRKDLSKARKNPLLRKASFVLASAEFLPFKKDVFNKILLIDVIEHIFNDKKSVLEASRVLKPTGRLVLTTLKKKRRHYLKRVIFKDHLREYSWKDLEILFTGSKLKIKDKAEFYKTFSTIAWEIRFLLLGYRVLPHLLAPILVLLSKFDFLCNNEGGGMALMAEK